MKIIKKYFVATALLFGIFFSLLFISSFIPREAIYKNMIYTSTYIGKNSFYIEDLDGFTDQNTDIIMVNEVLSMDEKKKTDSVILSRRNYLPGFTKNVLFDVGDLDTNYMNDNQYYDLLGSLTRTNSNKSYYYYRYWHGYLIFLRPLLLFFDINDIYIIHFYLIIFLLFFLSFALFKRNKKTEAILIMICLLASGVLRWYYFIHGYYLFISFLIFSILITLKIVNKKNILLSEFCFGAIIQYLDFLSCPPLAYLFPIIIYNIVNKDEFKTYKDIIVFVLLTGINYLFGYTLLWFTKWLLTDCIYNFGTIKEAYNQIVLRTSNSNKISNYNQTTSYYLYYSFKRTLQFYMKQSVLIGYFMSFFVGSFIYKYVLVLSKKIKISLKDNFLYIICMLIMVSWFVVLKEHTSHHYFFTYRNWVIILICLTLMSLNAFRQTKKNK